MEQKQFCITMQRLNDFEFRVSFDQPGQELLMDEPEPLGGGKGPNAARVLSAAIGNCLSASLLFCLQRARAEVADMKSTVTTTITRNEKGRFRIGGSEVLIEVEMPPDGENKLGRCLDLFEDFCIVTASVRQGIDVEVKVKSRGTGEIIYDSADRHD